ncbi:MAG: phosphoesterase, PA-phosphatase-like protein [Candidatus Saccharibacteria bacterium]|nr:phosphoesterase, PA-phosphatase-like protein [Candidatus Saccharibacteria bacterium]
MKHPLFQYFAKPVVKRLFVGCGIFLIFAVGFVSLANEVFAGETIAFDQAILRAIHAASNGFWDWFFVTVTQFGGVLGVIIITALIFTLLIIRRNYRRAMILIAGVGGAALINVLLKFIFERPRPNLWHQLVVEHSFSFPSGHAMASSALALSIIAICWNTRYRIPALILSIMYILIIGISRLYLGVHYPTDIMAGWLVSTAWVLIVVTVISSWQRKVPQRIADDPAV